MKSATDLADDIAASEYGFRAGQAGKAKIDLHGTI